MGQPSRSPRLTAEIRKSIDEDAATAPDMPDFRRLTRDHNPDDPFEARRLVDAGARLGRMRQGGEERGPHAHVPRGLAVSRAIGDLNASAVICRPECTRVPVPPAGGRLVLASDGLWNALGDAEVATVAHEAESAAEAAAALMRAVMQRRGAHDDITIVVVDAHPPPRRCARGPPRGARAPGRREVNRRRGGPDPDRRGKEKASTGWSARARRRSLERGAEPPPDWAETRADQARANRGRKFDAGGRHRQEGAGPRPRRRRSPRRTPRRTPGTPEFHLKIKNETRAETSRPVNAGCLACLLGGGVDHSALADVDDADAEAGATLRDDYVLGAVLGRGMYGSVRLAYLKSSPSRRGSRDDPALSRRTALLRHRPLWARRRAR